MAVGLRQRAQAAYLERRGGAAEDTLDGISVETVRVIGDYRDLVGLRPEDAKLLTGVLDYYGDRVRELHTHVPCGWAAVREDERYDGLTHAAVCGQYARRCDAAVLVGESWDVIECKPIAGHKALGQALFYGHHLAKADPELEGARLVVACSEVDPDFLEVYGRHGVTVMRFVWAGGGWASPLVFHPGE